MDKGAPANVDSMVAAKQFYDCLLGRRCAFCHICYAYPVQAFYLGCGIDVATKARAETVHGQLSVLKAKGLIRDAEPVANGVLLQFYAELFLQFPCQGLFKGFTWFRFAAGNKEFIFALGFDTQDFSVFLCSQATLCNCFMGFLVYN